MKTKFLLIAAAAGFSAPNFGLAQSIDTSKIPQSSPQTSSPKQEGTMDFSTVTTLPRTTNSKDSSDTTTTTTLKMPRDINGLGGGVIDGGGGDEVGLVFQSDVVHAMKRLEPSLNQKDYAKLKSVLEKTKYFVVNDELIVVDKAGKKQFSAAKNFPTDNTIYIQRQRWGKIKDVDLRQRVAAHEVLSLAGIESTGDYHLSSKLSEDQTVQPAASKKGDVLYNRFYNADPKGLMADSAADICQEKKNEYADQYYFVYCSYWQKPIRIGHSCDVSAYEEVDRWGYHSGYSRHCGDDMEYVYGLRVYGLRVYGLGKNSELTWKTVFSSKNFDEYGNEDDAQDACMMNMLKSASSEPMWTSPRCHVEQDGAKFFYEIQTQNPLAHETK